MAKTVAVFNQKGGVGKTTLSLNVAHGISLKKKKVLFIDLDPQANATSGFGFEKNRECSVYRAFAKEVTLKELIQNRDQYLDVVASSRDLSASSFELTELEDYTILREVLKDIKEDYDYIFIDCPPSLGVLSMNGLVAADTVLIPIQCEYYSLEGLSDLMDTINRLQTGFNPDLKLEGVVLTMVDRRNNLTNDVANEVKRVFGDFVYDAEIPRNVKLAEAPSYGQSIFEYSTISKGAWALRTIIKEFLKRSES